jgi:hypothetical protein
MNPKKLLIILVSFIATAFLFSKILFYYVESTTPNVVLDIENSRESNPKLELILGGYAGFETTYNENDFKKDTLPFKVKFFGKGASISLNALAKRQGEFKWRLIRIDTTYLAK